VARILYLKEGLQEAVVAAADILHSGGILIYPTDTVYGIGCSAESSEAVEKIFHLKQRPAGQPFSVFFSDPSAVEKHFILNPSMQTLLRTCLPGALTLILDMKEESPWVETWSPRLFSHPQRAGIRIPDHPFCLGLKDAFPGAVVTSSVNISGRETVKRVSDMLDLFAEAVDLYIVDEALENASDYVSSTVLTGEGEDSLRCLREGKIPYRDILSLLGK